MTNQQTGWIIAAIIVAGIIIASMVSKQTVEAEPYEYTPVPSISHTDVMEERAIDCIAAGHEWTGYSCNWYTTP